MNKKFAQMSALIFGVLSIVFPFLFIMSSGILGYGLLGSILFAIFALLFGSASLLLGKGDNQIAYVGMTLGTLVLLMFISGIVFFRH